MVSDKKMQKEGFLGEGALLKGEEPFEKRYALVPLNKRRQSILNENYEKMRILKNVIVKPFAQIPRSLCPYNLCRVEMCGL